TKAKRRVTLSMVGLGMLDESEVETIPGAQVVPGGELPAAREVPRLSAAKADSLSEKLAAAGVEDPLAYASDVLMREVRSLRDLTTAEALRVFESLPDQDEEVVDVASKPADPPLSVDDFADPVPSDDGEQAAPAPGAEGLFPDEKPKGNGNGSKLLTSAEAGRLH